MTMTKLSGRRNALATILVLAACTLLVVGCATSGSAESDADRAAADTKSSAPIEPTRYTLPVEADILGDDATVRAGIDGRLVVVGGGRYWILSVDGVSEGGTAEEIESGEWSAYHEGVDLAADGEVPEAVREFAATAEAAGVTLEEGQSFRGEVRRDGDAACWRVTRNDGGWRAEPVADREADDCTSRWLYTVSSNDGTYRFETYHGDAITHEGGIAMASQTYLLGLEQVVNCSMHPRQMYGSSDIPEDRRLADDLGCGWKGGEVRFPVEGARYVGFREGFDGSLAMMVIDPERGPMVYLAR